ncbi:16S rRNA (uracil(1498)-N(3))-methyltransferase [Nostoc sp. FACHB-87]|uniref:16S rRNA (uracil(1498)-N(3))-methyltransferase n=1 Tax=Nostocaceae TaxID=1162 RepID=UPI001686AE72|nr:MULTISPECIES: 16S rRNA (uracil(1498)-N(3))-methyltransferase [Nostocaceae]MBD2458018.1 16S rRNA (uracil(1498)-N(3))-methyltransferase [Nostoc sp. FACHB-87]MBD2479205.1 16S rRNA (uracil(1498)-N(3))-methyltransferase [Anabaena sp. FACHB-83]
MAQLQRIAIAPAQFQQDQILLTPQQLHYLGRVLRLREGDRFIAMDGMGKWWLTQLTGKQAQVLETLSVTTELPVTITLMMALPKGSGFDEVVRCCTEIGVTCIAPVISDRTLLHPSPQKLERWRRIAAEAAEQSERAFVPTILEPVALSEALSTVNGHKYICEARGNYPHLLHCLPNKEQRTNDSELIIATGPEGGWTEPEIANAIASGFQAVSLGRRVLRAVTAPIVALSLVTAACEV